MSRDKAQAVIKAGTTLAVRDALINAHDQPIDLRWWLPGDLWDNPDVLVEFMEIVIEPAAEVHETCLQETIREAMKYHTEPDDHERQWLKDRAFSHLMLQSSAGKTCKILLDQFELVAKEDPMKRFIIQGSEDLLERTIAAADPEKLTEEANRIVETVIKSMYPYWHEGRHPHE